MEATPWRPHHGGCTMEARPWRLHHGVCTTEDPPWRLHMEDVQGEDIPQCMFMIHSVLFSSSNYSFKQHILIAVYTYTEKNTS